MYADNGALSQHACIMILTRTVLRGYQLWGCNQSYKNLRTDINRDGAGACKEYVNSGLLRSLQLFDIWQSIGVRN